MPKAASDQSGFATRNIPKGTYLTLQDYSSQKVIAEKTFVFRCKDLDQNQEMFME